METRVFLGLGLGSSWSSGANQAKKDLKGIGDQGTASAKQIAQATRTLPAQFTDIATSLAGGQNPFLVMLQQGGQIRDQFGSIGAAARGIGGVLGGTTAVILGAAAAVGTLGYGLAEGARQSRELQNSLQLTGNAAGLTLGRFDSVTSSVVAMSQQTVSGAREIVAALAATGQTSGRIIERQAQVVARIADLSGRSGREIAAGFATQLDSPAKFAAKLNESYNFLNVAQFKRIQQLDLEKRNAEAVALTNETLLKALDLQRQNLGYLESAWDGVRKGASKAWDAILGLGRTESTETRIASLRKDLDNILKSAGGKEPAAGTYSSGQVVAIRSKLLLLAEQAKQESSQAAKASEQTAANREKIDAALNSPKPDRFQFSAITDPKQQYKADFLRSEKAFYDDLVEQDRKLRELARQDPLGEFITERVLPDADKRAQERLTSQSAILQELVDANERAGIDLLANERERGQALIELDRQIAVRRLQQQGLAGDALTLGIAEVNRGADMAAVRLDRQIGATAKQTEQAMTESVATGILNGFRQGGSFADIFLAELRAKFAETILQPLIRPQVEAGNELVRGLIGSLGELVFPTSWADTSNSMTGEMIRGRRASGGPVSAGSTYLVGESGPELLRMGRQGGTVVPNRASGGTVVNMSQTVHVDARADQARMTQMVAEAQAQGRRQILEELHAMGVL